MASVFRHKLRNGFRICFYIGETQREYYFPGIGKKAEQQARAVAGHLEDLANAKAHGIRASAEAIAWSASLEKRNREKLVRWGLVEASEQVTIAESNRSLGAFVDAYLKTRTDAKATTITNYKQTRRLLVEYFGESKALASITAADAEKWRRWLLGDKELAQPTVSKHVKRAKTLFAEAVSDRILKASPFEKVKAGSDRGGAKHHLAATDAKRILEACPDRDWRCVFALARWGGLRRDCEIQSLKWTDIDWAAERININSGKTGLRQCPLFPELRKELLEASEVAPSGSVFVVGKLATHSNLGAGLAKIVIKAGVAVWPKMFNALRASRRTELEDKFPGHVVDAWLGHSSKTAKDYYLQVTDDHWQAAGQICSVTCSVVESPAATITNHRGNKKPQENQASDGSWGVLNSRPNDPYGVRTHVAAVKGRCPRPLDEGADGFELSAQDGKVFNRLA